MTKENKLLTMGADKKEDKFSAYLDDNGQLKEMNHIQALGLTRQFFEKEVDLTALAKTMKTLSMQYHPDRNKNDQVRANIAIQRINDAYDTMKDEQARQAYLAKLDLSSGTKELIENNLELFGKIYKGLLDGKSGPKSQSKAARKLTKDTVNDLVEHIRKNPGSRSAQSLLILKRHLERAKNTRHKMDQDTQRLHLFKDIYSASSAGFFSKRGLNLNKINTLNDLKSELSSTKKHTRSKNIFKALGI
jgi:curved DNA-binding protein CbpA